MESKDITLTFEQAWYNSDSASLMEAALYTCNELENQQNKMESRNIALTLEKAREWYNSGSADLKEVALQAYKEEELEISYWESIKTFEDAYNALGMSYTCVIDHIRTIDSLGKIDNLQKHLIAVYKLDIIRKALNKGWEPKMTKDGIYNPYIRIYSVGGEETKTIGAIDKKISGTFKVNDATFYLVGGDYTCCKYGLSNFDSASGNINANPGLLGCKNSEIARHMSKYFAKEIFDACYAQYIGAYEWVQ